MFKKYLVFFDLGDFAGKQPRNLRAVSRGSDRRILHRERTLRRVLPARQGHSFAAGDDELGSRHCSLFFYETSVAEYSLRHDPVKGGNHEMRNYSQRLRMRVYDAKG